MNIFTAPLRPGTITQHTERPLVFFPQFIRKEWTGRYAGIIFRMWKSACVHTQHGRKMNHKRMSIWFNAWKRGIRDRRRTHQMVSLHAQVRGRRKSGRNIMFISVVGVACVEACTAVMQWCAVAPCVVACVVAHESTAYRILLTHGVSSPPLLRAQLQEAAEQIEELAWQRDAAATRMEEMARELEELRPKKVDIRRGAAQQGGGKRTIKSVYADWKKKEAASLIDRLDAAEKERNELLQVRSSNT